MSVSRWLGVVSIPLVLWACGKSEGPSSGEDAGTEVSAYSVGGTVTGLEGTGLVLASSTGEKLAVTESGSFTFLTKLPPGASWTVAVESHPTLPSQGCEVQQGSGVIDAADVTQVVVACTTRSFKVGGTISGLEGEGLQLQLNEGDPLAIVQNGAFQFGTEVKSGAPFVIVVAAQPSNPAQTCVGAGLTGTMGGADVSSVSVVCATNNYSVGGTVSGLNGTVELVDAGGQTATVTSNGSWAFPNPFLAGSAYSVSLKSQPPGQTCSLTGASGTVVADPVTGITVSCTDKTFTVGGSVSGLTASEQVELQLGSQSQLVQGAGPLTFTFAAALVWGSSYQVTVGTAPIGKTCTVSNGSGTSITANVTNVQVTCATSTFDVGGTVTGLGTGKAVILKLNGTTSWSVIQNGPFSLPDAIAYGGGYEVTVHLQPAGQRCDVSQGVGTNVVADVTSIQVACADVFPLGGTVTGLSSGELLALHNGAETLNVAGSASGTVSFTFLTAVAVGSSYAVTATGGPTNKVCTVSNGAGVMPNAPVTNVAVDCVAVTHLLSGTVAGLAVGEQVVLKSGTEQLSVNATSTGPLPFAFATRVDHGGSYQVTLLSQPSQKACSIQNATGQNVTADVTNVQVVCSTAGYSVGGTVAGLGSGKTLVLRNGNDLKAITADGPFTFDWLVPEHGAFNVVVETQPDGQRCTVAGGTSSDVTANVTTIQVTCADAFSIGGGVTGLANGKALVLSNGTENLTVSGTAATSVSFTFVTRQLSGTTYSVTVTTQPNGHNCTVANGSGTIASANVSNVSVTCVITQLPVTLWALSDTLVTGQSLDSAKLVSVQKYDGLTGAPVGSPVALTLPGDDFTNGGNPNEGGINMSTDGQTLVVAGYDAPPGTGGTSGVQGTSASTYNRLVGVLDGAGSFTLGARINNAFSADHVRGVATVNGSGYWVHGWTSGIHYVTPSVSGGFSTTTKVITDGDPRRVRIFDGRLYWTSGTAGTGTSTVRTTTSAGLPTSSTTSAALPGVSVSGPIGFWMVDLNPAVTGVDTLYVNTLTGGLKKFTLGSTGGTWSQATLNVPTTVYRDLVAVKLLNGSVKVFVTSDTQLLSFEDDHQGNPITITAFASVPAGTTVFRGLALVP